MFLVFLGSAQTALAGNWVEKVEIHGFGDWSYGQTSGENTYLHATPEGSWDFVDFSLALRAELTKALSVSMQANWNSGERGLREDDQGERTRLELAFVSWTVTEQATLRFGRARIPFGVYGELFHAGVVRPFVYLPQSVYGPSHFSAESFDGVSLTGEVELKPGWSLAYDAFGGEIPIDRLEPHECVLELAGEEGDGCGQRGRLTDTFGGRLLLRTPGNLSAGLSFYTGRDAAVGSGSGSGRLQALGVQVEYVVDSWQVRAEAVRAENKGEGEVLEGGYLELAYDLTDHWQLATRYDTLNERIEPANLALLGGLESLLDHRDLGLGVNYWVDRQFVLKLSVHRVTGNHFSLPGDFLERLETEPDLQLDKETTMFAFGASFSF